MILLNVEKKSQEQNIQCYLGYKVCFGTTEVVLFKSHDVDIVQNTGGVFNMGEKGTGDVGQKMEYIHSSSCDHLVRPG